MVWDNFLTWPNGLYSTDIIELTSTINFNLLPGEVIIDYWPLNKECHGTRLSMDTVDLTRPYYSKIISMSNTQAVLKTYYYKFNLTGAYSPELFPANIRQAFTLYTYDSTGTVGLGKNFINFDRFAVYPNPSTGHYDVVFSADKSSDLSYKVFNILGQEVRTGTYSSSIGKNNIKLNMSDLTNGVYILNIFDKGDIVHKQKLIKN